MTGDIMLSRAVVSGSAGFLGRCLVKNLLDRGTEVLGIDLKPVDAVELPPGGSGRYRHEMSSLTEACTAGQQFLGEVPRLCRVFYHAAGIADLAVCREDPLLAFHSNVALTMEALDCCREAGGAVFVFLSSGLVYGDAVDGLATEEHAVTSASVYAATKLAAETMVRTYADNYACPAIIARLSNVYGPGANERTVVGRILGQVQTGNPLNVLDERPVRDFVFSEDAAEGLVRLAYAAVDKRSITVNLSTATAVSIGEVVETASHLSGSLSLPPKDGHPPDSPPSRLVLSNRKLKKLIGWTPQTSLTEGLQKLLTRL